MCGGQLTTGNAVAFSQVTGKESRSCASGIVRRPQRCSPTVFSPIEAGIRWYWACLEVRCRWPASLPTPSKATWTWCWYQKLGAPGQPEVAIGAVDEAGSVLQGAYFDAASDDYIGEEIRKQREILRKRRSLYTQALKGVDPAGRACNPGGRRGRYRIVNAIGHPVRAGSTAAEDRGGHWRCADDNADTTGELKPTRSCACIRRKSSTPSVSSSKIFRR